MHSLHRTRTRLRRRRATVVAVVGGLAVAAATLPAAAALTRPGVTPQTGVPQYVSTLMGAGLADVTPVDVAATKTTYYVLDVARYRIAAISRSTGKVVNSVGGGRGADPGELAAARSLALDKAGNLYVADTPNNRISVFSNKLKYLRQFGTHGTGPGQFSQVYGVAVGLGKGPSGSLREIIYTIDGDGRIQKFLPDGTLIGAFAPGADLTQPRMAEINPVTHDLWVVNARDRQIVVFDVDGHEKLRFGQEGTGPGEFDGDPRGIAISPDGTRVYVSDEGNHRVEVFNGSGTYLRSLISTPGSKRYLVDARGLATAPDGTLIVTDEWAYGLKEWNSKLQFTRQLFGNLPPAGGVNSPRGLAVDSTGRVFISDWWNQRIQRINANGTGVFTWGQRGTRDDPGAINFAWGLAIQPGTNRVFLANRESHEIEVFTSDGAFVTRWGVRGTAPGQFTFPQGVAFDPTNGSLLVTDSDNGRIERFSIDSDGNGTLMAVYGSTGAAVGQLDTPAGIAVASDGTIWVADTRNDRIQRMTTAGVWTAYTRATGAPAPDFAVPWGVSIGPDGNIWVADSGNDRIVVAKPTDMSLVFSADGPAMGATALNQPYEVDFGAGGLIYIADTFNNRVITVKSSS